MRLPTLFPACVLLVTAFNVALAARRLWQLCALPPALAETYPTEAFAARLDAVTDPAELRQLALARHRALLAADHTTQNLLGSVGTIAAPISSRTGSFFCARSAFTFSTTGRALPGNSRPALVPDPRMIVLATVWPEVLL